MNTDPAQFRQATPFPHVILDDLCPGPVLEAAMPAFEQADWRTFHDDHENDKSQAEPPPCALMLFRWMRTLGPRLEEWTGISGLELDLLGGGLHQTTKVGHLDMHVDFNRHPDGRYRRLNMLLYANKSWAGGSLELRRGDQMTRLEPSWNRLVVFETGEDTWHGHPTPWASDIPRRSFAAYWYTKEKPVHVAGEHSTVWA